MPRGGWNDSSLASIFSQVLPRINATPSPSTSPPSAPSKPASTLSAQPPTTTLSSHTSTSLAQPPATTPHPHTSNGLVGGVAGGAVAAAVLLIVAIILVRRRRKQKLQPMIVTAQPITRMSGYRKPELADNGIAIAELPDTGLPSVHELATSSPPHRIELPGHYEGYELATGSRQAIER